MKWGWRQHALENGIATIIAVLAQLNLVVDIVGAPKGTRMDVLRVVVGPFKDDPTERAVGPVLKQFQLICLADGSALRRFFLTFKE